jgi:hypothetical protein
MLTSYNCILKNDTYGTPRHRSGSQSFLFYCFRGVRLHSNEKQDRRDGYSSRGRGSLRFKVVRECRPSTDEVKHVEEESSAASKENHMVP